MKTYLVTGGSGFLGAEMCRQLKKAGKKVIDVSLDTESNSNRKTYKIDITQNEQIAEIFKSHTIGTIIHLAALLTTQSNQNPELAFRVNILGSLNLLELARLFGVTRFVYASSYSSIGYLPPEDCPVDESVIQNPGDLYGETKRFVEKMGIAYSEKFGFQFIAGRLGSLVGSGKTTPSSAWRMDIFNMLKTGGQIHINLSPQVTLALSHVQDTARSLLLLATAEKVLHHIYHLPSDSISMEKLGKILQSLSADIEVTWGTSTLQNMPPSASAKRFTNEFNFVPTPLVDALRQYQSS
jgi:nucleoside-diphosphate-sugar epimerase